MSPTESQKNCFLINSRAINRTEKPYDLLRWMSPHTLRLPKCLVLLTFLFFLQSCGPKIEDVSPPLDEQPEPFSESGTEILPENWWTSFDSPELNALIKEALESNLGLTSNWYRFRAALAVVDRAESSLWPQIQASAGKTIRSTEQEFSEGDDLQIGGSASYELDLWGRIRAGIQAEEFRKDATYFDYQSAAMTISAETALTWFSIAAAEAQLELAQQQIKTNEDIMKLIRARFASGQIRAVDILRQQQLLESTRNQKIFYETEIALLKNELAVLLGNSPQNELDFSGAELPELPPLPKTGLPLELVRRRPDIQQAYHLVLAADREMAQAIRSRYPRISLDLAGSFQGNNAGNLFQNWAYTLAGNILAPLFYGGQISAEIDRTEAVKKQQLYQYGQVVLNSFQEVENALIREMKQKERIDVLERQLSLVQKTNEQLRIEFLNGISNYLDVLLSLDQEQQLQRDLLEARLTLYEIRVSLYRALAGGFEPVRETEELDNQ